MPSESDNWSATTPNLSIDDIANLDALDELRREQPVLFMLLVGIKTATRIAELTIQPREHVMAVLRAYKASGLCYDEEGRRSIYWHLLKGVDPDIDALHTWISKDAGPRDLFKEQREW